MKDKMIQILVTDLLSDAGISVLKDANIEVVYNTDANKNELLKIVSEVDGWIIRSSTDIDEDLIKAVNNYKDDLKTFLWSMWCLCAAKAIPLYHTLFQLNVLVSQKFL